LAALLYLAGLPALIMRRLPLLLLPAAVLVWFAYRQIQYERQPREYRRAMRHYLRGDYDDAIEILEGLRDRLADHIPTYFLLAQAYVRERRFDEAMEVMSCVADDCPDAADLMERNIWLFKRIDQRRHQTG
jgi:tetratricopeptide (TPR) repeat protein